jgi:hypothetical protein
MSSNDGRVVAGFDTEDDGQGNPFLWCIVHDGGKWSSRNAGDFLQYVANMRAATKARGKTLEVWATNLEYDLCNTFDASRMVEVGLRFGRSALVGASWRGGRPSPWAMRRSRRGTQGGPPGTGDSRW